MEIRHATGAAATATGNAIIEKQIHHSIDNATFLQAIFRNAAGIWITSFNGDPNDDQDKGGKWKGRLWRGEKIATQTNNYFCIANLAENNGAIQRRKICFGALHCLGFGSK